MASVQLPEALERRLQERVTNGEFPTLEEALAHAVEQFLDTDFAPDQLDRLVKEGMDDIERGDVIDGEAAFDQVLAQSTLRRSPMP